MPSDLSPEIGRLIKSLVVSGCSHITDCVLIFFAIVVDTSCILAWLIEEGYEVYAFMADVGQEEVLKRVFTGARTTDTIF